MGVVKKKRSHHGKASRQQYYTGAQVAGGGSMGAVNSNIPSLTSFAEENNYQYGHAGPSAGGNGRALTYAQQQLNKQRQDFERVRLRPEPLSNIIHDESDTISFRSHQLKNFISSNDAFNMLSLTTVPCDNIRRSRVFSERTAKYLAQKQRALEAPVAESEDEPPRALKYTDLLVAAENGTRSSKDLVQAVFVRGRPLRHQRDGVVVRRDEPALVGKLRGDLREAPADYWTHMYRGVLAQYREARQRIQQKDSTAVGGQEDAGLQQQQQQQEEESQQDQQQQGPQQSADAAPQNPNRVSTEKEAVPTVEDDPLENMFGDYSAEPFNTNFDDEFGDLDAVFF